MSTFSIPNNGQIRVNNTSDVSGELSETFNIDLSSSQGKIKVSRKLSRVLTEGVDIATPAGFVDMLTWDGNHFVLTEDEVYACDVAEDPTDPSNWTEITAIGDLDLESTAVVFDGLMRISKSTGISEWNGSATYDPDWWTVDESGPALTALYPHVLEVVQSQKETIYVTDKNLVHYLEKGSTVKTVTLDSNVVACCLAPGLSGAMWVGTYNETNGNAQVYEIYTGEVVGSTSVYRQAYPVDALAVLAIWMVNNTPYIVTERGEIKQFNGAGFSTVAEFPFKFSERTLDGVISGQIQASNRSRPIHPKGVRVHNDSVFINVNMDSAEDAYAVNTRSHTGVWEFNYKTGQLNHRFAFADQTNNYGSSVGGFAYPILIVDNQYTFLIAGGYDGATSKDNVYMTTDAVNQGWFVTPEIMSQSVADAYESVYHKAKTMTSGEEIVLQYRTSKRDTAYGTANWTSTDTFVTTDDWSSVSVGDLVRVSHGYAAGDYANVTEINASTATCTVTVDREIGANTETSYVYSDNFQKDPTTYTQDDGEWKRMGGYGTNPWIQFMVILNGDIEYRQFICKGNSKNEL
jgi:hypothetical protein